MTGWRIFGAAAMLASCLVGANLLPVHAQGKDGDAVKMEFKAFASDSKPFFQTLETDTTQKMTVQGQEVTQTQKQTFYIKWTPEKSGDDKSFKVSQKIIGVKMNIDIGGNKIAYDSTDDKQPNNPMSDFFAALKSLELTLVIDKATMKVTKVEGRDAFVTKLKNTNPQMGPLLDQILGDEAIKQMAQPTWGAIPREAVKKGQTWKGDVSSLNLGAIGSYETSFEYTFKGVEDKLDVIDIKSSLKYSAPKDVKAGVLPFVIKGDSTLSSKKGSGVAKFNPAKGRIDYAEMKMELDGNLVIEVGGMETKVVLSQTQSSTMKASDDDPIPSKTTK